MRGLVGMVEKLFQCQLATVDLWASCEENTEKAAVVLRG